MSHGGVARRDVVVAVEGAGCSPERAAHDQPHDELDAFRARLAQILDVRNVTQLLRVTLEPVEEPIVPLSIDQPGARALELWLMPPVPHTWTSRSSGKLSTARAIASPSAQQRLPVGGG